VDTKEAVAVVFLVLVRVPVLDVPVHVQAVGDKIEVERMPQ
jgi:hypothetical protein